MKFKSLLKNKPYLIFGSLGLFLFVVYFIYFFFSIDSTLAVNVHDTYYVVAYVHLLLLMSIWVSICSLGYWILHKMNIAPVFWMTLLHFLFSTFLGIIFISNNQIDNSSLAIFWFSILSFIVGQIIYLMNLLISIIIKRRIKH